MNIIIVNGPNLNMLGKRNKTHYGTKTLEEIQNMLYNTSKKEKHITLSFFQSNHEGDLIDYIQRNHDAEGLVINPGALAHYSLALADALRDFPGKKVEVHLSQIKKREEFRKRTITAAACDKLITGKKEMSYVDGLLWLIAEVKKK